MTPKEGKTFKANSLVLYRAGGWLYGTAFAGVLSHSVFQTLVWKHRTLGVRFFLKRGRVKNAETV